MTLRRTLLLLTAGAVVVGAWRLGERAAADIRLLHEAAALASVQPMAVCVATSVAETRAATSLVVAPAGVRRMPETLPAEAAALVAEQAVLRQMTGAAELALSDAQWATLAEITSHYQAVRHAYEASIASVTPLQATRARLEVPAYPGAGDALRRRLGAELQEKLGTGVATEVTARMGCALEGYFGGFGVSTQTLDFVADAAVGQDDYQVRRTVTYWNGVDAGERLTTRSEVHFPGLEDPSGYQWGPFLSLLASRTGRNAGS